MIDKNSLDAIRLQLMLAAALNGIDLDEECDDHRPGDNTPIINGQGECHNCGLNVVLT